MALNEVYRDAFTESYSFGSSDPTIKSGEFVWVTASLRGVAETDSAKRADGNYWATLRHIGGFTGTTADAVTVGAPLYIAAAATHGAALTATAGSNKLVGSAMTAKGAVAGNVVVRINN